MTLNDNVQPGWVGLQPLHRTASLYLFAKFRLLEVVEETTKRLQQEVNQAKTRFQEELAAAGMDTQLLEQFAEALDKEANPWKY